MSEQKQEKVTILASAGRLSLGIMRVIQRLAEQYGLDIYLTNAQNIRLTGINEELLPGVKEELIAAGAQLKEPGTFLMPKVCTGPNQCKLAVVDPVGINDKIIAKFGGRENVKGKVKLAISGCNMCCSNAKLADIGIVATRKGFEVYAGGKGGAVPKVGIRIAREVAEEKLLDIIEKLVDFHDQKTVKKQRMFKLLSDPDFPYAEI